MTDAIHFVDANGLTFAYLEQGSGPLVLMLHGFPDTAHTWDDLRTRIAAKGYRAVSPFMRGYHPTAIPERDPDQETLARDALALIEALGASKAVVIGHDWGASAAYGAAALGPQQVTKLFAVAIPHPGALKPSLKKLWGVRHFAIYKLPGAPERFARNDFAALPAICRRWSPNWSPDPSEFDPVRACFSHRAILECGVRLLPKAFADTQCVAEDANHRAHGRVCRAGRSCRRARRLPVCRADVRRRLHRRRGRGRAFHAP